MEYFIEPHSLREGAEAFCRSAGAGGGYHPAALLDLLPKWEEKADIEGVLSLLDLVVAAEALACHWGGKMGISSRINSDWEPRDDDLWIDEGLARDSYLAQSHPALSAALAGSGWTLSTSADFAELVILNWASYHHGVSLLWLAAGDLRLTVYCAPNAEVQGLGCTPGRCLRMEAMSGASR